MQKLLADVAAFHVATDTPINTAPYMDPLRLALRRRLLAEEAQETDKAFAD